MKVDTAARLMARKAGYSDQNAKYVLNFGPLPKRGFSYLATAHVFDTDISMDDIVEELGTEVGDAVQCLRDGGSKKNHIARYVQKAVYMNKYLESVAQQDYEKANQFWRKVEVVK